MVDFRKSFLLTALGIAVSFGSAGVANAQTQSCTFSTVTSISVEGVTEQVPITLNCSQPIAVSPVGGYNFTLQLNAPVTTVFPDNVPQIIGATSGSAVLSGTNSIQFSNIVIGTGVTSLAFTKIRIDATQAASSGTNVKYITALISAPVGSTFPIPINNNAIVAVAQPSLTGLAISPLTSGASFSVGTCATAGINVAGSSAVAGGPNFFSVNFNDAFAGALKIRSEQGTEASVGSQIAVVFNLVPAGVTFYVPVSIGSNGAANGALLLAAGQGDPTTSTAAPTSATSGAPTFVVGVPAGYIAVTSGTAIYYNVVTSDLGATRSFAFKVYPVGRPTAVGSTTPTVAIRLAPTATDTNQGADIPRYLAPVLSTNTVAIASTNCQTSLLFPYLVNTAGYDTGVTIAATGTDPFGGAAAGGTCAINFYGANAPTTAPSVTVPTAGNGAFIVSNLAPGFNGYAIAVCTFQFAHGYAFITNGFDAVGGPTIAQGYVAGVITDRTGASTAGAEALSQ